MLDDVSNVTAVTPPPPPPPPKTDTKTDTDTTAAMPAMKPDSIDFANNGTSGTNGASATNGVNGTTGTPTVTDARFLLPPGGTSAAPTANDPPGTILPGDKGDLSINVMTQNGQQPVGINDLLNGNFKTPVGMNETPSQLGQNLTWQYLRGQAQSDGWQVNNDYAQSPSDRLDAVLRASDPKTAYNLLSGQTPDPNNSYLWMPTGPDQQNPKNVQDQQLLQSDFKQLVSNGTFTSGDMRELVDAQAGEKYNAASANGLDKMVAGLGNDPNSQSVRQAFADESIKTAQSAKDPQMRSELYAQASDAVAGMGKTAGMNYLNTLSPETQQKLIGGALDGQATQLNNRYPGQTSMGSAENLINWAAEDAKNAPAGSAGNPQRNLAANLWNGAMNDFTTKNTPYDVSNFSSNAQTLLNADGNNGIGLRQSLSNAFSYAFPSIVSSNMDPNSGGTSISHEGATRFAAFGSLLAAGPTNDAATKQAFQYLGANVGELATAVNSGQSGTNFINQQYGNTFGSGANQNSNVANVSGQVLGAMTLGGNTQLQRQSNANSADQAGKTEWGNISGWISTGLSVGSLIPGVNTVAAPASKGWGIANGVINGAMGAYYNHLNDEFKSQQGVSQNNAVNINGVLWNTQGLFDKTHNPSIVQSFETGAAYAGTFSDN